MVDDGKGVKTFGVLGESSRAGSTNGERSRPRTAPALEPMLALFERELIDLLRTAPRCTIAFSKLVHLIDSPISKAFCRGAGSNKSGASTPTRCQCVVLSVFSIQIEILAYSVIKCGPALYYEARCSVIIALRLKGHLRNLYTFTANDTVMRIRSQKPTAC